MGKIKSHDFKLKTKVAQLCDFSNSSVEIYENAKKTLIYLLDTSPEQPLALRLMGVRMSELKDKAEDKGAKQKSLHTFFGTGSSVTSVKPRYICPVCGEAQSNLHLLNDHIDRCIKTDHKEIKTENTTDDIAKEFNDETSTDNIYCGENVSEVDDFCFPCDEKSVPNANIPINPMVIN